MASPEALEASRERDQRNGVSRNCAAIDAAHCLAQPRASHPFDRRRDLALHRMVRRDIAIRIHAHRAGKADEARVFARAIVVQSGRRPPRARERPRFVLAERPMRAAFEHPFIVSRFGEHIAHGRDMLLAARVRRAGERNFLVAQTEAVRSAARDERQGLQRLDGGARINRSIGVAKGHHHPAVRIDDRARPPVEGFNEVAARGLDNHWVGHRLLSRREDNELEIKAAGATNLQARRLTHARLTPSPRSPVRLRRGQPHPRTAEMKVRDVMTYGVISVPEGASIAEAIETMLRSRVSALVVFDADHALSGILSEGDLLRRSELGSEPKRPYWLELLIGSGRLADAYAHEHGRKAGEVMTREVETITEDAELSEAVDRMIHRRIKRLPVLRGETLVGIVSRSDLLKGLLAATPSTNAEHSDAEIKGAILAELDKLEWAPRASVSVEVQNGAVTFDGSIIDERLRNALKVIAENTPGCVAVHDHMAWIEPNSGVVIPSEGDDPKA